MSHLGLNILSAIYDMSAIWDVRYWEISLYFIQYSSVSIVDFEQVNVAWDIRTSLILLLSFFFIFGVLPVKFRKIRNMVRIFVACILSN